MAVPLAGDVLADRYELLDRIGSGGMGEVWQAEDTVLQRRVAVKLVRAERLHEDAVLTRFEREAQTAARLVHPGLATVYDYGASDDGVFLVMELLGGETLAHRLAQGPLPPAAAAEIAAQVADALGAAHARDVVHRDVKPSNIMLTDHGAKLLDFGIASGLGDPLTSTGLVLGTPSYLAPERVRGEGAGPEADVYALGAVLYEALTGERAFDGATPSEVALSHLHKQRPDAAADRPGIPPALAAICRDAMAVDPAARPSAPELAGRLRALDDGGSAAPTLVDGAVTPTDPLPVAAPAPTRTGPPPPEGAGRWWLVPLVLLAVVGIGVVAFLLARPGDDADASGGPAAATTPSSTAAPTTAPTTVATTVAPTTVAPTTAPPATSAPPVASGGIEEAAVSYIETLDAGDLETAWAMTSPAFQAAQDRSSWEGYWGSFDSVTVAGEPQVDEASGTVVLPLSYDGRVEDYQVDLAQADDGTWLIDGPVGR